MARCLAKFGLPLLAEVFGKGSGVANDKEVDQPADIGRVGFSGLDIGEEGSSLGVRVRRLGHSRPLAAVVLQFKLVVLPSDRFQVIIGRRPLAAQIGKLGVPDCNDG